MKLLERLEHHPLEKATKDRVILQKISQVPEFTGAKKILFYLPIRGEVDLTELFKKHHQKKTFILPRVQDHTLDLYIIKKLDETEPGSFQISEPKQHLQKIDPSEIDIALIPGVVFSKNGHRIGYGKGHYDRLLKNTNCVKIGIAYDFQLVDNIAGEIHDIPMDLVITEKKIIKIED